MKFPKLLRCYICLKRYNTANKLFQHLRLGHSKRVIIKAFLKSNSFIFKSKKRVPTVSNKTDNEKKSLTNNNNNNITKRLATKSTACNCRPTPESSDTESCSGLSAIEENSQTFIDNAKVNEVDVSNNRNQTQPNANQPQFPVFCCQICYSFFATEDELKVHLTLHVVRLFVCPICNEEFFFKPEIVTHMNCHMEISIFETILNLENDYNVNRVFNSNFSNYNDSIASIIGFLNDHQSYLMPYNPPQAAFKVNCDICYREMFNYDYESHLQAAHYVGLRANYNTYM